MPFMRKVIRNTDFLGCREKWYGDIQAINSYLNGGTREDITKFFPMHFV